LAQPKLPPIPENSSDQFFFQTSWVSVERILRQYTEYHFGRTIRSAAMIDSYFASLPTSS
jgi:DNA repair protein RecO (recombination protein O)